MIKPLFSCVLIAAMSFLMTGCYAGTEDFGTPDDTLHAMERSRAERGTLPPTELPPGLGPDMPPPMTQPTPTK